MYFWKKNFGTEKAREDGALARSLKGLGSEDSNLDSTSITCHSLPDLTIGPASSLAIGHDERTGGREEVNIPIIVNRTGEGCVGEGSKSQVNTDPAIMYCSVESLLAAPRAEIKRSPNSRGFSVKKMVATKRNSRTEEVTDASAGSSPRNSEIVTEQSGACSRLPEQQIRTTTPVKKPLESSEEMPARDGVAPGVAPTEPPSAVKLRSKNKSRKQRYKTLTGSELLVPGNAQTNPNPEGVIQSDSENPTGRSKPGWRSSSLKGTPRGKDAEVTVPGLRNEGLIASRTSTAAAVPIAELDDYVVLVCDQLAEIGEYVQAVKVDVSKIPQLPLNQDDLANYLEATANCDKALNGSQNNVAFLLPANRNSSSIFPTSLYQSTNTKRVCIKKGNVSVVQNGHLYSDFMFLTTEFLLIMKQKTATNFKLREKVAIGDLWLAPGLGRSGQLAFAGHSLAFVLGWPLANNNWLKFTKQEQKNAWMTTLERLIEVKRSQDAKREVIIQIVIEDTGVTVKKSLVVTCDVTVSQVIQRCLKELHLAEGDPDNFELRVKGKERTIPLIGHELPLYIQLKNMLPSYSDAAQPQVPMHRNDPRSNAFDHFVLRRRKTIQRNGFRQRPRKTRRITLTGLFGRKALPPQPDVVQSTPQSKLFGRSFAEVCSDDTMPKLIMDLLRRLYVQGASTPGIFRKPGNQRDLQELKIRLDAGEDCNMDDISIHVAASALKSFLRDRPDCLLLSNLYCKWIEVICIHDNGQKQENMKRLVSLLPPSNLFLLRHLVCVLHHISLRSERNQMTSANLAICLGPTFLWPEGTVDLTSQFGSVELVTRVAQALIEEAQTIFGSDCLQLFRDLDDLKEPPSGEPELNFESEDSFGSHELVDTKREFEKGASLESLDSVSFEDSQSLNAVQSQMSADSGLAVSNPLLSDDPESPTSTSQALPLPCEGSRYAKRQLATKKKLHTKSELSDISEALTVLDPEERPNSKMSGTSNVLRRINRFQASRAHSSDEMLNDSGGDNLESSEDEMMFARMSISSSEPTGGVGSSIGLNSEDALSRELDDSSESDGKEEISKKPQSSLMDATLPETFLSERTERPIPSNTFIHQMDPTEVAAKNYSPKGTERLEGTSTDWYFTGTEEDRNSQLNSRNLRSVPLKSRNARKKSDLLKMALCPEVTSDDFSPVTSKLVSSKSLRHERTVKSELDVKPVKQSSLDSSAPSVISCHEMRALQHRRKPSDKIDAGQLCPRLTSFQVVENVPSPQRTPVSRSSSSDFVSSDCFVRLDDWRREREPCERSVPRRRVDAAVDVNGSGSRSSRGVQTDDCEISVGSTVASNRSSLIVVGAEPDETDGTSSRNANPAAYKFGRRYKSDLDLASIGGSWRQELDAYGKEAAKKFTSPVRIASEEQDYFPIQQLTPRQPVARTGSFSREPSGNVSEQVKVFQQTRVPVSIEQRVRDHRAVTVVTIGNETSVLPSKFDSRPMQHQPLAFHFPISNLSSATANQRLNENRRNDFIPSEPTRRRNLGERLSNGFQSFDDASFAHESMAEKFTVTPRMLPVQPRPAHGFSSTPLNSGSAVRQVVSPRHTDIHGHVFGGHYIDPQRNAATHFYVPPSKTETPRRDNSGQHPDTSRGDGLQQRSSQHRDPSRNVDSQRYPATRQVDHQWPDTSQHPVTPHHDDVRYASAGTSGRSSRPPFDTPRNARPSQRTETPRGPSSAAQMDETSGVTWSVTELKKVFDYSMPNTRFSPPQGLVRKH